MLRVFLQDWEGSSDLPPLGAGEAHHLYTVRRPKEGETVEVLNGRGAVGQARCSSKSLDLISVRQFPTPRIHVHLLVAMPKGKTFSALLPKAVELSVSRITPFISKHVEVRPSRSHGKRPRWDNVIIEAMKQSGNPWKPCIDEPVSFGDCLREPFHGQRLCGALQPDAIPLWSILETLKVRDQLQVFIGPEGDFSESEYAALRETHCRFVSLGEQVLKVDTAAALILGALSLKSQVL